MEGFRIVSDTRERMPWKFIRRKPVLDIVERALETGDYSIEGLEDILSIERKRNTAEIAANLQEDRFYRELSRLAAMPHAYVVCEFTLADVMSFPRNSGIPPSKWRRLRMKPPNLLRLLVSAMTTYGVPFVLAGTHGREVALSIMKRVHEQRPEGPGTAGPCLAGAG